MLPGKIPERQHKRRIDAPRAKPHHHLYGWRWQRESRRFLARPDNVLCVYCKRRGKLVPAEQVDHIQPHRGDLTLFWDRTNWQGLCSSCGAEKSAREQASYRTGQQITAKGCDAQGVPIDPSHHWNR